MTKLFANIYEVKAQMTKLFANICEVKAHMTKLSADICEVKAHITKLFANICEVKAHMEELFVETSNSRTFTSSAFAIANNVSTVGCTSLVHHFETVLLFIPIASASQIFVLPFSANTAFILLKIGFSLILIALNAILSAR